VSFAFDSSNVYILASTGQILKFDIIHANPQTFTLKVTLQKPVGLSTGPGLKYVWVADPGAGRVLQLDDSGNVVRTYVSGSSTMDLHQIKSFAVGPAGNTLYVLCGSKIFDFPVNS
jgi:DNA-binding beta-propeller fold protein YncE